MLRDLSVRQATGSGKRLVYIIRYYPIHTGKAGVPGNAAVFYAPPRALASPQGDGTRLVTSRGRRTARRRAAESANVDPPFRYLLQNDRPSRGPALCVRCGDVNERVTHERV